MKYEYGLLVEWYLQGVADVLGGEPVLVPQKGQCILCFAQSVAMETVQGNIRLTYEK